MNDLLPPLVTNADRDWALAQCPSWARRNTLQETAGEIVDDGGWLDDDTKTGDLEKPNWDLFVTEQIERFEKFFADQRKGYQDWSNLWRKSWWPKARPQKRFPRSAPKKFHPFFRRGSPEFARAMAVGTKAEVAMWQRFNVAQFAPDDPRLERVQKFQPEQRLTRKELASGEREG